MRPQSERIALKYLPGRERQAIELKDEGLTYAQIGHQLNVTPERAKQIYQQALTRLDSSLGADTPQSFYIKERFTEIMVGVPPRTKPGIYLEFNRGMTRVEEPTITRHTLESQSWWCGLPTWESMIKRGVVRP